MMKKQDFYPSRLSLNVWWGFFWRTALFALILMQLEQVVLALAQRLWMHLSFGTFIKMIFLTQQHPLAAFIVGRVATALCAVLPAMVLAWWMMLSAPVYRTYTLRHIRTMTPNRVDEVAHGVCGATRLGWSTFWRLIVNVAPLHVALFALEAYQVHLATTTLENVPGFNTMVIILMLPVIYLFPLTLQDILRHPHRRWSLTAHPHTQAELLSAFVPGALPTTLQRAND